jgi:2'-hydroxyisoflavone reductase
MRMLIIGGTRFVGRAITEEAARRGHQVSVFHRGSTPVGDIPGVSEILGDRDTDRAGLAAGQWDATIDVCAYRPHQVDELAEALSGRGGHHTFISTVSFYDPTIAAGSDENAPGWDTSILAGDDLATVAIDGRTYGPLKVLCEERARAAYESLLMIRPTFVIGPDDYTMRYPKWVERIAAGGQIDAPFSDGVPVQYIDARDQAAFIIDQVENQASATFNCVAPDRAHSFRDLLETTASAVAPADTSFRWLSLEETIERSADFPLWGGVENTGPRAVSSAAALAAGMRPRPLADSAKDTLAWLQGLTA